MTSQPPAGPGPEEDRRRHLRARPASGIDVAIPGVEGTYVVGLSPAGMRTVSETGLDEAEGEREALDIRLTASGETLELEGRLVWHEILLTPQGRRYVSGVEFLGPRPEVTARLERLSESASSEWTMGAEGPV